VTVSVCSRVDLRAGAASLSTWADGFWLQSRDGAAVLLDTHHGPQPPRPPPPPARPADGWRARREPFRV